MAEVTHTEQPKKRRPAAKFPRVDMTPMVDLAFLLLTFFVLTSNLHKSKAIEMTVPHPEGEPMPVYYELAKTILIDGNSDGIIHFYAGKFEDAEIVELSLGDNSLRDVIAHANATIQQQINYLQTVSTSGKFTQENYDRITGHLQLATASQPGEEIVVRDLKNEKYTNCIGMLEADLAKGVMSEATSKAVCAVLRGADSAPFFIIKWGENAKYEDVIAVIDELQIGEVAKYAVTEITVMENDELLHHNENAGNGAAK